MRTQILNSVFAPYAVRSEAEERHPVKRAPQR